MQQILNQLFPISDSCVQIWFRKQSTERGDPLLRGDDLLLQAWGGSRDRGVGVLREELQRGSLHHGGEVLWVFWQDGVQVTLMSNVSSAHDKNRGRQFDLNV